MNKLEIGFDREVKPPKVGLFIGDTVAEVPDKFRRKVFDPRKHHFNPLTGIDERGAQDRAEVIYTIYPQGENTLRVREGKWELAPALMKAKTLDKVTGGEELTGIIGDLLFNPLVRDCLCGGRQFVFDTKRLTVARLNRAEIGDRAALTIGLFLMATYPGQIIVPDFGFYGRDAHTSLIRENRLIAGVNTLSELSPKLRQAMLLMKEKAGSGATAEDAETLATYMSGFPRGTEGFNSYRDAAMA